jgi:hypothetical protein
MLTSGVNIEKGAGANSPVGLYRRDEPKEAVDSTYWEAVEHLMENWRTYAESYERAHGDG